MKLRTNFFILIVGIIIVPYLVISSFVILRNIFFQEDEEYKKFKNINEWQDKVLPESLKNRDFKLDEKDIPPQTDVLLLSAQNRVLKSTVQDIVVNTVISPLEAIDQLEKIFQKGKIDKKIELEKITYEDTIYYLILCRNKKPKFKILFLQERGRPPVRQIPSLTKFFAFRPSNFGLITILGLLFFTSIMSVIILRRITKSIRNLEYGTKQIASGKLDFHLDTRGTDEIASLSKSFDKMRIALKEEYAKRARFIMGVSHDLKTPLSLIKGYVEAIQDGFARNPEILKQHLSIINKKAGQLESRIYELIEYVKLETDEWRIKQKNINFNSFLEGISKIFKEDSLIYKRKFNFQLELKKDCLLKMNEKLITRAFENIIGNAIRYSVQESEIEMKAVMNNEKLVVTISNQIDPGINLNCEQLFEPFYRGSHSRREDGFGLGLTIAKSIIDSHGWNIDVKRLMKDKIEFDIRIPLS